MYVQGRERALPFFRAAKKCSYYTVGTAITAKVLVSLYVAAREPKPAFRRYVTAV